MGNYLERDDRRPFKTIPRHLPRDTEIHNKLNGNIR
jgi:hypothetical protein